MAISNFLPLYYVSWLLTRKLSKMKQYLSRGSARWLSACEQETQTGKQLRVPPGYRAKRGHCGLVVTELGQLRVLLADVLFGGAFELQRTGWGKFIYLTIFFFVFK